MFADYPQEKHIPQLRSLWKEAFEDTDAFLDGFFEYGFSDRRCRCIFDGDVPVSVLYWFEAAYQNQRFAYLYAVATAKSHRGRGLFSALLEDTKKILTESGFDGILLHPATESLGKMYGKLGFFPCTTVDVHHVCAADQPIEMREIGPVEFANLRRSLLPAGGALQEGHTLRFLASQYHFWAGEGWLAVGQVYDGELVCQEFLGDRSLLSGLVRALQVGEGTFRTPGKAHPFVWALPLKEGCRLPDYFALALD